VIVGDRAVIAERARMRGLAAFDAPDYISRDSAPAVSMLSIHVSREVTPGTLDKRNAKHVLKLLDRALDGCVSGEFDAMVTAPVQKSVLNDAGIPFTGHTEYLAERTHTPLVVMLLAGGGLRVALATTHLALSEVPRAITRERLEAIVRIVDRDLKSRFGIARPRILVAGLNPHAGESGYLGREEIEVIAPAVARLRQEGLDVSGPFPADSLFARASKGEFDAVLAQYHDQGLIPVKLAAFGHAVNVTLGLPFVRTSVDHGTGFDIVDRGIADESSLLAAIRLAADLVTARRAR
jgi:4-hydroxythreonine-4-phosphate dehydrogenase